MIAPKIMSSGSSDAAFHIPLSLSSWRVVQGHLQRGDMNTVNRGGLAPRCLEKKSHSPVVSVLPAASQELAPGAVGVSLLHLSLCSQEHTHTL